MDNIDIISFFRFFWVYSFWIIHKTSVGSVLDIKKNFSSFHILCCSPPAPRERLYTKESVGHFRLSEERFCKTVDK